MAAVMCNALSLQFKQIGGSYDEKPRINEALDEDDGFVTLNLPIEEMDQFVWWLHYFQPKPA